MTSQSCVNVATFKNISMYLFVLACMVFHNSNLASKLSIYFNACAVPNIDFRSFKTVTTKCMGIAEFLMLIPGNDKHA